MKNTITIVLALSFLSFQEPNPIKISDILGSAYDDIVYQSQLEKLDYLRHNPFEVPLFNRVEFRTETRDFDPEMQEYALRFKPNSFSQRKYNKKYYQSSLRINEIQNQEALNRALTDRYERIIDLIKTSKITEIKQRLKILLEDRITVLTRALNTVDFDYEKLMEAEDDYHEVQLELIDLERKDKRIRDDISVFLDLQNTFELDTSNLVDVDYIERFINTLTFQVDSSNLEIAKSMERIILADHDFNEEKSQENNLLGFFQTTYRNDLNDPFKNDLRLSLGIRLPIANSSQPKLNRLRLKQLDKQNDLEIIKSEVSKEMAQTIQDIQILMEKYQITRAVIEEENTETSLRRYLSIEGISPLILLKIQESIIKKEIILSDLEKKIFDEYLKLLKVSGKLVQPPLRNYFSKLQEEVMR
ncbi:MAG: hypothetical protein RJQ09_12730 [Cyclobacteriaceae bacterium]